MKEFVKLLITEWIIVIICAIVGLTGLSAIYLIPQKYIQNNIKVSSAILHKEGEYGQLWETIKETVLDGHTDGLMLNVTYTATGDSRRDVLLNTKVKVAGKNPMDSLYEMINALTGDYKVENYGRYWHGYQLILGPLFCFFTYADIRQINMILQIAVVFYFILALSRSGNRILCIPFFGMYVFLSPVSLFSSLQYSPCFYIMMGTLTVLIAFERYMKDSRRNYLFLSAGILTAFFDLMTYPLVTLGVPLIAYLGTDRECLHSIKKGFKSIIVYSLSWVIGYVGMWMSKWIIASVLTEENVILDAIEQMRFRSIGGGAGHTCLSTIKLNMGVCNIKVLLPVFTCIGICILVAIVKNRKTGQKLLPGTWMLLLVTMYPFVWYCIVREHSWYHSFFTWRELAISVWGVIMIGVVHVRPDSAHL